MSLITAADTTEETPKKQNAKQRVEDLRRKERNVTKFDRSIATATEQKRGSVGRDRKWKAVATDRNSNDQMSEHFRFRFKFTRFTFYRIFAKF